MHNFKYAPQNEHSNAVRTLLKIEWLFKIISGNELVNCVFPFHLSIIWVGCFWDIPPHINEWDYFNAIFLAQMLEEESLFPWIYYLNEERPKPLWFWTVNEGKWQTGTKGTGVQNAPKKTAYGNWKRELKKQH